MMMMMTMMMMTMMTTEVVIVTPKWNDIKTPPGCRFPYLMHYINWILLSFAEFVPGRTTVLSNELATPENIRRYARECKFLYIHGSHGLEDTLTTNNYLPAINLTNADLLYGKTTLAIACLSARLLGTKIAEEENRGIYIGYNDDLYLEFGADPLSYWIEETYKAIWTETARCLLSGYPVKEALRTTREAYEEAITLFIRNRLDFTFLKHNEDHLVGLGDTSLSAVPAEVAAEVVKPEAKLLATIIHLALINLLLALLLR